MKILLSTTYFYPSLGGSETDAEIFAREFVKLGHTVKVITQTIGNNFDDRGKAFPFEVVRQPSASQLLRLMHWSDVCFQNGIILKQVWALWLTQTPWVIRHQTWIQHPGQHPTWLIRLKLRMVRLATSISISQSIADHLNYPSTLIPNPYREDLFRHLPEIPRFKELVFLGRLVSDKGLDLLLSAIANLKNNNLYPQLTIIGTGEDDEVLRQQAKKLQINEQIHFVGAKVGNELVQLLNEHQILVVPSRWHEPFGVVALEGIACGCVVIGSSGGGLKDAIGNCGTTFPNGDEASLRQVLYQLLTQPELLIHYRANAPSHLAKHQPTTVAQAYLQVLAAAYQ
ncbi:glycosyltransferase [Leptolyngbya sp. CCNP1308]|uniref:glycosyltransferase family 4 protein n=1 Tax=Leptolyngbya sp. CCNP1308 TaxID=3110255 RepID=UPI002B1FA2A2|nr:glycosyltransferase [Leptolyngbya sp. CCNP1308]MEA5448116.1 glycosyltransferase [Leptolyngbya sp. CCNP1308]